MPEWAEIDERRRDLLERVLARTDRLRDCLTAYETVATADDEIDRSCRTLLGLDHEREAMCRVRVRTVASFLPVNQPLYALVLSGIVPALMAESVTVRPSAVTAPVVRGVADVLGIDGALGNLRIAGTDRADFIAGHVGRSDAVVFTGSHRGAVRVLKSVGRDALFVHNGSGVNPIVVSPDADLESAVSGVLRSALYNSGQDCAAPDCVLVHRRVHDDFVALVRERIASLTVGAPRTGVDIGPVARRESVGTFVSFVLDNADHVVAGGQVDVAHRLIEPTVLSSDLEGRPAVFPELYAPVINIRCFDDFCQVSEMGDRDDYQRRAMYATTYGTVPVSLRNTEMLAETTVLDHENGNAPFGGLGAEASFVKRPGCKPEHGPVLLSKVLADA